MSEEQGIKIATEFHPDTLTSNVESCLELLRQVNSQNFLTYFQPPIDSSADDNARIIARLNGKIENAHVFYWKGYERLALSEGISYWQKTLSAFENFKGVMYLEFVKDDSAENFLSDAAALNTIAQSLKISNR